jgi:hypothetical protein
MKPKYIIIIAASFLIFLSSCEKVIDINLDKVEKKYVIEAIVTDQPGTSKVSITQTKDFNENNSFPGVTGATVSISESGGPTYILTETSAGEYEATGLMGNSGKTYSLNVTISGKSFTATCKMPPAVNLDTIYVTDELLFTETRKIVNAVFQDPVGLGNSYRFIQYVNGFQENQILIRNDDYSDGRRIDNKLFYFSDSDNKDSTIIHSGDEVTIDMLCIDPAIYKYWFSLDRSSTGGSGQATPANPVTNIQGGALGYFSAHTLQTKTMIVP